MEMKTKSRKNEDRREKRLKMIYIYDYCIISIGHWIIHMCIRFPSAYFTAQLAEQMQTPNGQWINIQNAMAVQNNGKNLNWNFVFVVLMFQRIWLNRMFWPFWFDRNKAGHIHCICQIVVIFHMCRIKTYFSYHVTYDGLFSKHMHLLWHNFRRNFNRVITIAIKNYWERIIG